MKNEKFHNLLKKYLKGEISTEDKKEVDAFYRKNEEKIGSIINDDQVFGITDPKKQEEIGSKLYTNIKSQIISRESIRHDKNLWLKIAATVMIAIGVGWLYQLNFIKETSKKDVIYLTKTTERGQKRTVKLSDGTIVKLNAESKLTYPETFANDKVREVSLEGEAFFDVETNPEKPFIIQSRDIITTVLGTSFNINAYSDMDNTKVTVETGKVLVTSIDNTGLYESLTPGKQAVYSKKEKSLSVFNVSSDKYWAWKEGILLFENMPLTEAFDHLGRWYNVDFIFENSSLKGCTINGEFKESKLENILDSFKYLVNIQYEIDSDKRIRIRGKPCL